MRGTPWQTSQASLLRYKIWISSFCKQFAYLNQETFFFSFSYMPLHSQLSIFGPAKVDCKLPLRVIWKWCGCFCKADFHPEVLLSQVYYCCSGQRRRMSIFCRTRSACCVVQRDPSIAGIHYTSCAMFLLCDLLV